MRSRAATSTRPIASRIIIISTHDKRRSTSERSTAAANRLMRSAPRRSSLVDSRCCKLRLDVTGRCKEHETSANASASTSERLSSRPAARSSSSNRTCRSTSADDERRRFLCRLAHLVVVRFHCRHAVTIEPTTIDDREDDNEQPSEIEVSSSSLLVVEADGRARDDKTSVNERRATTLTTTTVVM